MRALVLLAVAASLMASTPATAEVIGRVKIVSGQAFVVSGGQRNQAKPGDTIDRKDVLETGPDGSLGVTFNDDTLLSLGPDTSIALEEYAFAPAQQRYGFAANLTRGTALFVSGLLGKLAPGSVSVKTPSGTIGIRGTRFAVQVVPGG
jgi:hypothetical protein